MFLQELKIERESSANEIVQKDYRTADIFRKYGIDYCCGGRWTLENVCKINGIEEKLLIDDLSKVSVNIRIPSILPFEKWSIDFLIDYIIHVHHYYLLNTLPSLWIELKDFAEEHPSTYAGMNDLLVSYSQLQKEGILHVRYEEEVIFPYLRQVAHAYQSKDSFAGLLVKTLRKPIDKFLEHEHNIFANSIYKFRALTNDYMVPEQACAHHRVVLSKLRELDNDLVQHIHLEKDVLFPRVMTIEKELLEQNNNPS